MNILNMKIIKFDYSFLFILFILLLCGYIRIGIFISLIVIIHELGHVLICKLFKYKIINVTIYPFGGITKIEKDINTSPNKEIILASAGIIMQIILIPFIKILNIHDYNLFLKYNLSIMIFNMLPIIPLDGSTILKSILNKVFSFKTSYKLYIIISVLSIVIYIILNYKYSLNNYLIIGIFIYKIFSSIKEYKYIYNRFLLERYLKKYKFKYISTKSGSLDILKLDTYQYFKEEKNIVSEAKKLQERFDKSKYF